MQIPSFFLEAGLAVVHQVIQSKVGFSLDQLTPIKHVGKASAALPAFRKARQDVGACGEDPFENSADGRAVLTVIGVFW